MTRIHQDGRPENRVTDPLLAFFAWPTQLRGITVRFTVMDLTSDEQPVVRRAVAAYEATKRHEGPFRGTTADEILEELKPSPVRWTELAAFVIETAEGATRRNR